MPQSKRQSTGPNDTAACKLARQDAADGAGWFKVVLPVAVIAACAELGTAILNNSTLPLYFPKGLGMDTALVGWLLIPFFISEALFKSPLGCLADRIGRKPLMMAGASVTIFTPLLLMALQYHPDSPSAIPVLIAFGLLRLLDGLGGAALWPALYAYIGDNVAEAKRGAAMALLNMVYMLALAVSFLVGGYADDVFGPAFSEHAGVREQVNAIGHRVGEAAQNMNDHLHHRPARHDFGPVQAALHQPGHYFPSFYLTSVLFGLAVLACAVGLKSNRPGAHTEDGTHEHEPLTWQAFMVSVRLVPQYIALAFVTFLGIGHIAPIVKLFAIDEFHLTEQRVGVLMLRTALIVAAVAYPLGHLADKWGRARSVRLGFFLCALGLWGIPVLLKIQAGGEIGFMVSAAIIGMGFVIAFPAWNALMTTLADAKQRGAVIGAVSAGQGMGVLVGFLSGETLYKPRLITMFSHTLHVGGHAVPFVLAAILVTIGAVASLTAVRERRAP